MTRQWPFHRRAPSCSLDIGSMSKEEQMNTLTAGQLLKAGERLESPNGRFVLLLQEDGNLVLYSNPIAASSAYWSSDTWWLPPDQRPASVEMQTDAHLVLYDPNRVPRWASGTWGPAFIDPHVVLQDDGNLVIYHDGSRAVWASGGVGGVGRIPAVGYVSTLGNINFDVDKCGRMPPVASGSTDIGAPTRTTVDANGVAYIVTEQRRQLVSDVIEHAFLQDIARLGVWPGQVIQGKALLAGDVAPIGPLPRQPGTINVSDLITDHPEVLSADVDAPDEAKVNQARRGILNAAKPMDSPGSLKTDFEQASTLRELGVRLGISVKGSAFGVDANAALNQTYKQTTAVASIRQVFYSVGFEPRGPQATGIWTGGDGQGSVTYDDLDPFMDPGNPPLLISNVQYGRFICVTVTGSFSSSDIAAALNAYWKAAVSGSGSFDLRTKEIIEGSRTQIYTIGVPGYQNFQNLSNPISELQQVFKSGLSFNLQNLGAPISFTAQHVADRTLAHVGLVAQYVKPLSVQGENISDRPFYVFDGPGGGLVDTRISVNPGDDLTISTDGEIWSGVAFSGTHQAEGWPGHRADRAAPLPTGTAYALVLRFGMGPWVEAGRFWQGSPGSGGGGVLQLNVNDNNPYNGDPTKRWTSRVSVRRGGAASAGVYI
jgi:hypothetical protein